MARVVLSKAVLKLGRRGEVKEVADGYFRNFLHPRGLAVIATPGRVRESEGRIAKMSLAVEQVRKNAAELSAKLEGAAVVVYGKATPKGKLYAAIGADQIIKAIDEQLKIKLPEQALLLDSPVKTIGKTNLSVQLSDEVRVTLSLEVSASKK